MNIPPLAGDYEGKTGFLGLQGKMWTFGVHNTEKDILPKTD